MLGPVDTAIPDIHFTNNDGHEVAASPDGLRHVRGMTEEEIEKEYQNIADMYQMPLEDVKKYIDPEMLKNDLKNQRAYDFVKENAKR